MLVPLPSSALPHVSITSVRLQDHANSSPGISPRRWSSRALPRRLPCMMLLRADVLPIWPLHDVTPFLDIAAGARNPIMLRCCAFAYMIYAKAVWIDTRDQTVSQIF